MASGESAEILRAEHVSKRFGITQALSDVSVSFRSGEVHALMGENGAGKSTLGKTIAGLHKPDTGRIVMLESQPGEAANERTLEPGSIRDAFHAGIRLVHQELAQCPNLSVAENLCLHDIPRTRLGTADDRAMRERAARLLARLEPGIDVSAPLGVLSPGHRQIVQIASALDDETADAARTDHSAARVIVLDEPTSSLSIAEVERLLGIVRQLASEGLTIIYVSHRMSEIFAACDRVTVLRDGKFVATSTVKEIDEATLVRQMIGRSVAPPTRRSRAHGTTSECALEVSGLSSPGGPAGGTPLHNISLRVEPGEVVGVGGLVGAGRSELLDAIFGLDRRATGLVRCCGRFIMGGPQSSVPADESAESSGGGGNGAVATAPTVQVRRHAGPRASIAAGMGYVPEDRKLQGLFFLLGVGENIVVPVMPRLAHAGIRDLDAEHTLVQKRLRSFQVKAAGDSALPGSLSGGNQQKLLIARWLGEKTRVLLLDEPTRGIDVGTKAQIYDLIRHAASEGLAVLLISSEMPELLALSDRVLVLSDGHLTGELHGDDMTQANILTLATVGH